MNDAPTLTDRYIAATTRWLPRKYRADIERELRASIVDAIEARVNSGESYERAEFAVLRELGDPDHLAEQYAQTPTALISRRVYFTWSKTSRLLCAIVLPILFVILAVVRAAHHDNIWATIFPSIGITLTVAMWLLVANTALFVAVDRHAAHSTADESRQPWTPDLLTQSSDQDHR